MLETQEPVAVHPVAWLRPLPDGYKIPIWRWVLLPATTWMLHRSKGVWVNGDLRLMPTTLRFTPAKLLKNSRAQPSQWEISLDSIQDFVATKGVASETLTIYHADGEMKLMTLRSEAFVSRLREAIREHTA